MQDVGKSGDDAPAFPRAATGTIGTMDLMLGAAA
jgi:hypothetical protein